ncbi:girdin-like [Ptychodera flava]|uniref:girdin-like n=1 Tax=Ptychodera flava TaxID=63121 RepID=UPI00396A3C80
MAAEGSHTHSHTIDSMPEAEVRDSGQPSIGEIEQIVHGDGNANILSWSTISYGTAIDILQVLETAGLPVMNRLPDVLRRICSNVLIPKRISSLIRKIRRVKEKAEQSNDFSELAKPVAELQPALEVVGKSWEDLGITVEKLTSCDFTPSFTVTNKMVLELNSFRQKYNYRWSDMSEWLQHILCLDVSPDPMALKSSVQRMMMMKNKLSSKAKGMQPKQELYLNSEFQPPKRRSQEVANFQIQQYNSESSIECEQINETSRQTTVTGQYDFEMDDLKDQMEDQLMQYASTGERLLAKCDELEFLYENDLRSTKAELNETKKTLSTVTKEYNQLQKMYDEAKQKISANQTRNVNKRLKRKEEKMSQMEKELKSLKCSHSECTEHLNKDKKKIEELESTVDELKSDKTNLKEQVGMLQNKYHKESLKKRQLQKVVSREKLRVKSVEDEKCKLEIAMKELKEENMELKIVTEDLQKGNKLNTFHEGKYTDEIRLTCYELLNKGVSTRNVSKVIEAV